jgi:hypothetical protein
MNAATLTDLKIRCDGGRSIAPPRLEHVQRDGRTFAAVERDVPDNHRGYGHVATVERMRSGSVEMEVNQLAVADPASGRYLPQRRHPDADKATAKMRSRFDLTEDSSFTRQIIAACPCGATVLIRRAAALAAIEAGETELVLPHRRD